MDKKNIQEEIAKKIHPYIIGSNFFRRTIPLNLRVNGFDIYLEILNQTKEITTLPIYFNEGRSKKELILLPEESRIILARFNAILTQLKYSKISRTEDENFYAYLSMNSNDKINPFLGTGVSVGNKYYGLSFLMIDEDECMMEEIANTSLESLVKQR